MQTIVYQIKDAVYVNLTNRCPCACTFCLRTKASGVYGSPPLWLEREPAQAEIDAALDAQDWTRYRELVFCGYGEPTERLDALLAAAARRKALDPALRVRVNTNGLSDLVNGRPTAALFVGKVDCISISLNTDNSDEYLALCRPKFGPAAFPALLRFAREAAQAVPEVVLTVVGEPVTDLAKQTRCRALAESLGATLRVRPFENGTRLFPVP